MRPNPTGREPEKTPRKERINEFIKLPEVQCIDADGNNLGVIPTDKAREMAQQAGLDLVEINPLTRPPICKIMDFGKYKYQQSKKQHDGKHKQQKLKEVRLTPKTEEHDLQVKIRQVKEFLTDGDKVQVVIKYTGREIQHKELGENQLKRLIEAVQDVGKLEGNLELQGKRLNALLIPEKRGGGQKAQPKAESSAKPSGTPAPVTVAAPSTAPTTPAAPSPVAKPTVEPAKKS